ncbi:MAG TPA: HAD-IA family hydrolase [Terracidiphilus sp.]|nr:HAD-IA family hydrolase [Terracidiphilus sp.]
MFPFDAVLFDVGGVLLTNGWDHRERALVLAQFGLDRDEFEALNKVHYPAWERGATTVDEYLDRTIFYQPRAFSHEELFSAMCAQSVELENGALGILSELAASKKCMVGFLNNEARETNEFRFEKFGLRAHIQVALSSCYLNQRKPDPAIYRCALDILGVQPARVMFIDDRTENAAAAAAQGIHAIRFEGADALRNELNRLGVL